MGELASWVRSVVRTKERTEINLLDGVVVALITLFREKMGDMVNARLSRRPHSQVHLFNQGQPWGRSPARPLERV